MYYKHLQEPIIEAAIFCDFLIQTDKNWRENVLIEEYKKKKKTSV